MASRYLDMMRSQARRQGASFTSKQLLAVLALIAMMGSAVYWWGVQSTLIPNNKVVAIAYTALLVLAPPSLVSFLIPWSPAGMLLQKVNAKTWGYGVVIACSIYLLYYSFQIQWSWWAAQQVVAESGLIYQQVFVGMIGFIIIPALLWTPVSSDELVEQVRQAHLVKRYELQTQADIAILRATLLYYSFQIQWSWWAAQQVVAESGLIYQQVFVGMIGFILIPALLWTPVSSDELVEQVRQAHLVKRYELQTQADIAILRATLLRAQEKALIGFANLTVDEREELASVMRSLVGGIDRTLREVGNTVKTVSGCALPFDGMLDDNEDIRDVLDYIGESLTRGQLVSHEETHPYASR